MSFREVRQFTQIMEILGYPNPIDMGSFDTPNFGLMAQLLQWLAQIYDPEIVIIPDLSNESGRVEFVRGVVQQLAVRSNIRLNPRKLYASDRYCLRELLKIATPIYKGITSKVSTSFDNTEKPVECANKIINLSAAIPKKAVELFDSIDKELSLREVRSKKLSSLPDLAEYDKIIADSIEHVSTRFDSISKDLQGLDQDEEALKSKVKQRDLELDRQTKRLLSVQSIRPAYMDEYESYEQELTTLFKTYSNSYRNVDYFEHQLQGEEALAEKRKTHEEKVIEKEKKRANEQLVDSMMHQVKGAPNEVADTDNEEPTSDDGF